jgi:hypothetical protein
MMKVDPIDNAIQDVLTREISCNRAMAKLFPNAAARFREIIETIERLSDDWRHVFEHCSPQSTFEPERIREALEATRRIHVVCANASLSIGLEGGASAELREQCAENVASLDAIYDRLIGEWERTVLEQTREPPSIDSAKAKPELNESPPRPCEHGPENPTDQPPTEEPNE